MREKYRVLSELKGFDVIVISYSVLTECYCVLLDLLYFYILFRLFFANAHS